MHAGEKADWSLVDFARQIAGLPKNAPEAAFNFVEPQPVREPIELSPAPAKAANTTPENPPQLGSQQEVVTVDLQAPPRTRVIAPARASSRKQSRRPDEIESMILDMLRPIDRCPERGFTITVYGSNPWNAMLTIRPEAGPGIDRSLWASRVQEIGVRLRDSFDVIHEADRLADDVRHNVTDLGGATRLPSNRAESA
jgi:hypothetical protein